MQDLATVFPINCIGCLVGIDLNVRLESSILESQVELETAWVWTHSESLSCCSIFSLSIGIAVVPSALFGLTLLVVGISIFILAKPTRQAPSELRAFSEWILIGIVWILTALIALVILTLR